MGGHFPTSSLPAKTLTRKYNDAGARCGLEQHQMLGMHHLCVTLLFLWPVLAWPRCSPRPDLPRIRPWTLYRGSGFDLMFAHLQPHVVMLRRYWAVYES
jgi:hypothetical protein